MQRATGFHCVAVLLVLVISPPNGQSKAGKTINSYAGKYIVYTDTFYSCEGQYAWNWNMKTSHWNPGRPNVLQHITGWINGSVYNVTDAFWLNIVMDARSNNMWKENAFIFKFPSGACSAIRKQIPEFYHLVFKRSRDEKTPCIIAPQLYEVNDEELAWLFPNFPVMPYGMYRFRLTVGPLARAKTTSACLMVECHIVPKLSSQ